MNQSYQFGVTIGLWTVLCAVMVPSFGQQFFGQGEGSPRQVEVFVNVYDHPKTGFSCAGKNPGDYYADPATKCAVYYVCLQNPTGTMSPQSFACPNGTIFSQATRVCRPHEEVFCPLAARYYDSVNGNIDTKQDFASYPAGPERQHQPAELAPPLPPQRHQQQAAPILSQSQPHQRYHHQSSNNFQQQQPKQPQQPKQQQNFRNSPRVQPTPKSVPIVGPVNLPPQPAPISSSNNNNNAFNSNNIARSFRNSNRNFNFALASAQQSPPNNPSPVTTTSAPAPPPPAQPAPSLPGTGQPGLADYEYDYGDYNETGLAGAASSLQSQILENVKQNIKQAVEEFEHNKKSGPSTSTSFSTSSSTSSKSRRKRHSDVSMLNRRKGQLTEKLATGSQFTELQGINSNLASSQFTCEEKVAGVAYADIASDCSQFFVCISISKGKLAPYHLSCDQGKQFNQALGMCDGPHGPAALKQCRSSEQYFVYNKWYRQTKKHLLQNGQKQQQQQQQQQSQTS